MKSSTPIANLLSGAISGALVATLILVLGWPSAPRNPGAEERPQTPAESVDPQLLELLGKLDRSLESLEVTIAQLDRPAPQQRPVTRLPVESAEEPSESPPGLDSQDLADALWALTQRMERLPQSGAGNSIPARDVVPVADKPAALGSGQWSSRQRSGDEAWREMNQSHRDQHYGWSSDDLGQSYGHPDELWFEEGDVAVWHYEYEVEPGVYEAQAFFLKDGTVFNSEVDWWDENEEEWDDVEFEEESDID